MHGGCDRFAGDAHTSTALYPTFAFVFPTRILFAFWMIDTFYTLLTSLEFSSCITTTHVVPGQHTCPNTDYSSAAFTVPDDYTIVPRRYHVHIWTISSRAPKKMNVRSPRPAKHQWPRCHHFVKCSRHPLRCWSRSLLLNVSDQDRHFTA
jgi:hypothetical protein